MTKIFLFLTLFVSIFTTISVKGQAPGQVGIAFLSINADNSNSYNQAPNSTVGWAQNQLSTAHPVKVLEAGSPNTRTITCKLRININSDDLEYFSIFAITYKNGGVQFAGPYNEVYYTNGSSTNFPSSGRVTSMPYFIAGDVLYFQLDQEFGVTGQDYPVTINVALSYQKKNNGGYSARNFFFVFPQYMSPSPTVVGRSTNYQGTLISTPVEGQYIEIKENKRKQVLKK